MRTLFSCVLLLLSCRPSNKNFPDGGPKIVGNDRLDLAGAGMLSAPGDLATAANDLATASDLSVSDLAVSDLATSDLATADPRDFSTAPPDLRAAAGLRDHSSRAPGAVTLPARGGSYIDPVFKTKIIRVTDGADGQLCTHAYSYWPALNANSTRLLLACDWVARLYSFDPVSDAVSYLGTLKDGQNVDIQFEGAYWSHSDPNILYAIGGTKMWRIDISKSGANGRFTLVRDFAGIVGYSFVIWQLGKSDDDNLFTFSLRPPGGDSSTGIDTIAYKRDTNQVLIFPRPSEFWTDESQVSKDGKYILVASRPPTNPDAEWRVWNWATNAVQVIDPNASERSGGHYDIGRRMVNTDRWNTGVVVRELGPALESPRNVFQYFKTDGKTLNWSIADHMSMRADDESFVVVTTYGSASGSWQPFEKEIVLVRTDGSGFVRLAHTRETRSPGEFFAQPRGALDTMGRHVVYTSDLGQASRLDVMILKLP